MGDEINVHLHQIGYILYNVHSVGGIKMGKGCIHYSFVPSAQERVYIYSYPLVCCAYAAEEGMGGELLGGKA